MNSLHVKASVACYFRYTRQNVMISFERPLNQHAGTPDVLTVDKNRNLIEIEVKVSVADMKNDAKKRVWKMRQKLPDLYPMPYQFYYAVPHKLKDKAMKLLDEWKAQGKMCGSAGLLIVHDSPPNRLGFKDVSVERRAPLNKKAKKLSLKEIVKMVKDQTGTLCSAMVAMARNQLADKDMAIEYYI